MGDKKIKELLEKLEAYKHDSEGCHGYYDEILVMICKKYEPELLKKMNEIVKNTTFWYA